MDKTFNQLESIRAQEKYCNDKGFPHFAPNSGKCWHCKKNIYDQHEKTFFNRTEMRGISVEEAASTLIIGCPHCNYSYCD